MEKLRPTLNFICVVLGIFLLIFVAMSIIPPPSARRRQAESHCIIHLKQLSSALALYAENYDDNLPNMVDMRIDGYDGKNVSELACPLAQREGQKHRAGYIYEYQSNLVLRSLITSKDLGKGRTAPLYDQDNDALLKCRYTTMTEAIRQEGRYRFNLQPQLLINH